MNTLAAPQRIAAVDAYRGMVMFLMLAEVLHLPEIAKAMPQNGFWTWLHFHTTHVPWTGCSLHDLIQPGFTFLVGVSLPFSIASRVGRGESNWAMAGHALLRAIILIFLGIFLRSLRYEYTNFTFDDTLTQIGLGYFALYLIGRSPHWVAWSSLAIVLVGYYLAFLIYPLPSPNFDYSAVGVPPDWPHHFESWQAHWNKNSNLAWRFDTWFMNLFYRDQPFTHSGGGYATLSFVPTLGTMILGLVAGRALKDKSSSRSVLIWMLVVGILCLCLGFALDIFGICPIVKRIWTPAWVLWSGGWCFLWLATLYVIMDIGKFTNWAFPFMVIGANSIVAYWLSWTAEDFVRDAFLRHFGVPLSYVASDLVVKGVAGVAVLAMFWLILFWMYRKKLFIRI